MDYDNIDDVLAALKESQEAEQEMRELAREEDEFTTLLDGQWEPNVIAANIGRPRYTLDKCNPILDDITGEMDQADFAIRVRPAGGEATEDMAEAYGGLIRNIEGMSGARYIYADAGRQMVSCGIAGWEVVQDWVDGDSFEQDLVIRPIHDYRDRVWFDARAEMQDQSDANHVFVLKAMTKDEYKKEYPDGSGASVGTGRTTSTNSFKAKDVLVGQIKYKSPTTKTLALMSDGSVREMDEEFEKIVDDLAAQGITIAKDANGNDRVRTRQAFKVVSRIFDGRGWLTEPEDTVFKALPVIPLYGNYRVIDGEITYRGAIRNMMDAQRIYNYTRSREIEEVALAPRGKYWATRKNAENADDRRTMQTLNTNSDPVQFFTHDPENPGPPRWQGGAQVNPGLVTASENSLRDIVTGAGRTGKILDTDTDGPLSGIAIQRIDNKADTASIKYYTAMEIAICATARVLVGAIPGVYDTQREVRIVAEDGVGQLTTVNEQVWDAETGQFRTSNDLRVGKYDVTCDVGPAFQNRQQETVKALQELSAAIPGLAELTADIQLRNIPSPGVDLAADRVRQRLVASGVIPEDQLTDEEKQMLFAAQQQPQQPTPDQLIATAEVSRVEAETADIISKSNERNIKASQKDRELLLKEQDTMFKAQNDASELALKELKLFMAQQAQAQEQQQAMIEASIKGQASIVENLRVQAETLKTLREAMGVEAIVAPATAEAYNEQAEIVLDYQDTVGAGPTPAN